MIFYFMRWPFSTRTHLKDPKCNVPWRIHFAVDSILTGIWSSISLLVFTKSETEPSLFWVNNTVCEWAAQLMGLLRHIVDFTLHTYWVLHLMRKYAVRTFGLWGVWLIWASESHLRGDQKSAREPTEQIKYQGNIHCYSSVGDWDERWGCFIGQNAHLRRTRGISIFKSVSRTHYRTLCFLKVISTTYCILYSCIWPLLKAWHSDFAIHIHHPASFF